jgi:hypothetical protein
MLPPLRGAPQCSDASTAHSNFKMTASDPIIPSRAALGEALTLSGEILRNLELSELPLANIALKVARLARILADFETLQIVEYEIGGYPSENGSVPAEAWRLAGLAGRQSHQKESSSQKAGWYCYRTSISALESELTVAEAALAAAVDRDVSITSANPHQIVGAPAGNRMERIGIRTNMNTAAERLASRRSFLYRYVLAKHYELRYSGIADDIFTRVRAQVDRAIGEVVPNAVQRFTAVYDNLRSDNPEDWSNAVHSCRRILEDLADAVFPATAETRTKQAGKKELAIQLGKDNYVNRLIAFIEDNSISTRFREIVGSQLAYVGDRLDSVFKAAQKGSHDTIVSRSEADRYVVYTYLLVGDILSLRQSKVEPPAV